MSTKVTNYPYLAGLAIGTLETLAYTLCSKHLVPYDKYIELQALLDDEITRIRKDEVEYSERITNA